MQNYLLNTIKMCSKYLLAWLVMQGYFYPLFADNSGVRIERLNSGSAITQPLDQYSNENGTISGVTSLKAPLPPKPDTTINLTMGTQEEMVNAIANARGDGYVTKIIFKANTGIPVDTVLPHFDMTDGKILIIDFNGGWMDYNTVTRFWFEAQHGTPQAVSSIGTAGSDAVLNFSSGIPDGLQVGDYVKVISEDRPPGGRSNYLKMGEAMKVKAISGLKVTLEGRLMQQGLYKTQIRATIYQGLPEGLWLINPKLVGDLSYDTHQIRLVSLIKPRIISPDVSKSKGQLISLEDNIETVITDPRLYEGVDGSWPNMTYGIYSFASKNTWVYRTEGSMIPSNAYGIRHAVDAGSNTPQNKDQVYRYGNDIGLRVTGLKLWDMLNVNASVHSGSWGALFEQLSIRRNGPSAAAGITVRGDYHTFREIDIAEVRNGWQIYNERGEYVTSPIDITPNEIVIDGGRTVVSGLALFTSNGAKQKMPVGAVYTKNAPYWESSTSYHLFDLNYEIQMFMDGDIIKPTGSASKVFYLSGLAKLQVNQITIDLSEFKGDTITLFHADSGSVVNVNSLNLVNPLNKTVIFSGGKGDVYDVSASDFSGIRNKWRDFLTGGSIDLKDPDVMTKVKEVVAEGQGYWSDMDKSTDRQYLWSDLAGTTYSYMITANYNRLKKMALAWATAGSRLKGNPSLLSDIIGGMEWMYFNRYNEYEAKYNNWWDWEIGAPLAINDLCILLYDQLTPEQIASYMRAINHFPPHEEFTGANLVWESMINAVRGVLMNDRSLVIKSSKDLGGVFPYVSYYDGFYEDGSFLQHLKHPYNGGYGKSLLDNLGKLMWLLDGTEFEVTDPNSKNVYRWIYDSYAPFIYKGSLMSMVRGREASSWSQQEHNAGHALIAYIARVALFAPEEHALAYKRMIKAWVQEDTYDTIYSDLTLHDIGTVKAIMQDGGIVPRPEPVMFKHYGRMDRTLQLRPGYAFGVAMHSSRIFNYESVNGENEKGWYTGDGMTYLYNNDLSQYSDYFWQTVNPYRLPGTTVDTHARTNGEGQTKLGMDWVGGAGLDNYGVAGMHLNAYGATLQARKSWFMFDDEIVALGAAITSDDGRVIETVIDNRKLNEAGDNELTVNGIAKSSSLGWQESMAGVNWIHLEGNAEGTGMAYYFPDTAEVYGLREERTDGVHNRNYMNLVINHGANPDSSSYAYVLLPNRIESQVSSYANHPDITIIRNDAKVQAVKENTLSITGINLWKDEITTIGDVTIDKKASLIIKESEDFVEASVSDPTQKNSGKIIIEINKEAVGVLEADPEITVISLSPTIKFTAYTKERYGKSLRVKFALQDSSVITLNPVADAHVIDGSGSNYGTSSNLETQESETAGLTKRAYLKFDLNGVPEENYTARLRVFGRSLAKDYSSVVTAMYEVNDDSWTETGINWNNKPEPGVPIDTGVFSTIYQWKDYDVSSFVNSQLRADSTASFAIMSADMDKLFRMNSRNNTSRQPVLYLIPKREIPVEGVQLQEEEVILNRGANNVYQLNATVTPPEATNQNVVWTVSNPTVVEVDGNGLLTSVADGVTTVTVTTEDGSFQDSTAVIVDSKPPVTSDDSAPGWSHTEQTITLSVADELSGPETTYFRINYGEWLEGNIFTISEEGIHVVEYYSTDRAGNIEESKTARVKIDLTSPVIAVEIPSLVYRTDSVALAVFVKDSLSGVEISAITLDGQAVSLPVTLDPYSLSLGDHMIEVSATDSARNEVQQAQSFSVTMDIGHLDESVYFGYNKGWINNSGVMKNLLDKIDHLQKLNEEDKKQILNGLNALENKTLDQYNKHIDQAYADLLLEDIEYLRITGSGSRVSGGSHTERNNNPEEMLELSVYELVEAAPNPSSGEFDLHVRLNENLDLFIIVYSMSGRMHYYKSHKNVKDITERINLSSAASGVYLIKVFTEKSSGEVRLVLNK